MTARARDKAAQHYQIDSFVPAQLNGSDVSAMIWAHLKEASREAAKLSAGAAPDDTSLHGRRSWKDLLANVERRDELRGLGEVRPEPVIIRPPPPELREDPPTEEEDPGFLDTLRGPATPSTFKSLLTREIVAGKDLPEDGSRPSWGGPAPDPCDHGQPEEAAQPELGPPGQNTPLMPKIGNTGSP